MGVRRGRGMKLGEGDDWTRQQYIHGDIRKSGEKEVGKCKYSSRSPI